MVPALRDLDLVSGSISILVINNKSTALPRLPNDIKIIINLFLHKCISLLIYFMHPTEPFRFSICQAWFLSYGNVLFHRWHTNTA